MSDLKTPQDNRLGDDAAYADGGAEPKNVQVGRYIYNISHDQY